MDAEFFLNIQTSHRKFRCDDSHCLVCEQYEILSKVAEEMLKAKDFGEGWLERYGEETTKRIKRLNSSVN